METPEDKAWTFFRKVLDNDEKYFTFKNKKEPIMLEGSAGGKYFLYPNGNIARLDKDKPHVGRISFGQKMPLPDFLSSIVVWITKNEHALKQRWGCGTINVYYGDGQAQYEDGQPFPNIRDVAWEMMATPCADDVLGVALTGAISGDYYIPILTQGIYDATNNTIHDGATVLNVEATKDVHVGDLIHASDVNLGGDGGHGENQIPEQERRRNTDTST